jgi:hypothetical protein
MLELELGRPRNGYHALFFYGRWGRIVGGDVF